MGKEKHLPKAENSKMAKKRARSKRRKHKVRFIIRRYCNLLINII